MKKYWIIIIISLAGISWSCQTEPDSLQLLDQMVVSTNFDPNVDFNLYSTYAIPTDTIGFVSNTSSDTIITSHDSDFPGLVLDGLNTNLGNRGFTRVSRDQNPDVGVNVMVVNNYNLFQELVYPDSYGYPGSYYYSGYYGYGGSYYSYPYVNTYESNTGVLIVEFIDLKNKTPDNRVKVIWDAYLGDVYSTVDLQKQTAEAINQAFVQSPYLEKK